MIQAIRRGGSRPRQDTGDAWSAGSVLRWSLSCRHRNSPSSPPRLDHAALRGARAVSLACNCRNGARARHEPACNGDIRAPGNQLRQHMSSRPSTTLSALLRGNARDLSAVVLDTTNVTRFQQSVYSVAPGHSLWRHALLWRDCRAPRRPAAGTRGGRGVGAEPVSDHRAVSPRDGGWGQARRLLCGRRRHDQTSPARHRGRASRRRTHAVRKPAAGRAAKPPLGRSVMAPKCSTPCSQPPTQSATS